MRISVLGLGYVGCISAACLARQGHQVVGVDVNPVKVELINQGKSPIVEHQVDEIIAAVVAQGLLTATTDACAAVAHSDLSLICVGTPSQDNGSLDLSYVRHAAADVGQALRQCGHYHVVTVRSTLLPGSIETSVIPLIEQTSGKQMGQDFGVCINPEFLREGSAVTDYDHPAFTLIGANDQQSGDRVAALYTAIDAPILRTDIRTAEMVKYASNAFHALKVSFANEIGLLCKALGIDSHTVMDIFVQDKQLNISPRYLKPGFAFGGSCLPKDLRALNHRAKSLDLELPVLKAILPSNENQIDQAFRLILRAGQKKVGVLGLTFKAGTDDLRESPVVQLVERLIGKGYDLRIYDRNVSLARIIGANKRYIEQVIPHISTLLVPTLDDVLDHAETLVIGNYSPEYDQVLRRVKPEQQVVDLVRVNADLAHLDGSYQGICW